MSSLTASPTGIRTGADPDQLTYQGSLFALEDPAVDASFRALRRIHLDEESWIDLAPRWMAGADIVFGELVARLPWRQREVVMYDQLLPEPRLTAWWSTDADAGDPDDRAEDRADDRAVDRDDTAAYAAEPLPVLADARRELSRRYGRPFDSIGFNLYRDGRDSVAWHGDRERWLREDPVVAIVSVGAPRPFHLRPRRPRAGIDPQQFLVGQGDLLVMGGACQHDWEHCVPKLAHAAGPRLSIMFRHGFAAAQPENASVPGPAARLTG